MTILHIDSSILGGYSVSRTLSAEIVARLTSERPDAQVAYRDLAASPVPHLSGAYLTALQSTEGQHAPDLRADLALGATLLDEFLAADTVVIGFALYNFGMPTQLKAWFDRILINGRTFRYTAEGQVEGLAGDKRVILAVARGGFYASGSPMAPMEHAETHVRTALGFVGINPEVISAEGIAVGPAQREQALAAATTQIAALAA